MWMILLRSTLSMIEERLEDLEGIISINRDGKIGLENLASSQEFTMVALFDPERTQYSEINFAKNIHKAISEIKSHPREGFSTDLKLVINSVDLKLYTKSQIAKYHIYGHSVPKFLFFSEFGKQFTLYKGGKSVAMIKAWLQR